MTLVGSVMRNSELVSLGRNAVVVNKMVRCLKDYPKNVEMITVFRPLKTSMYLTFRKLS